MKPIREDSCGITTGTLADEGTRKRQEEERLGLGEPDRESRGGEGRKGGLVE